MVAWHSKSRKETPQIEARPNAIPTIISNTIRELSSFRTQCHTFNLDFDSRPSRHSKVTKPKSRETFWKLIPLERFDAIQSLSSRDGQPSIEDARAIRRMEALSFRWKRDRKRNCVERKITNLKGILIHLERPGEGRQSNKRRHFNCAPNRIRGGLKRQLINKPLRYSSAAYPLDHPASMASGWWDLPAPFDSVDSRPFEDLPENCL